MSKTNSGLFKGTIGAIKSPQGVTTYLVNLIQSRVKGLDLREHPTTRVQLSGKKMKEIAGKIKNRTATKDEYKLYRWNKIMQKKRKDAVKSFWDAERERIINGNNGTRNWTDKQKADILAGRTPKFKGKSIHGHHAYSVSLFPHLAAKAAVIVPVTSNEHLHGWHGGNYRFSIAGVPIKVIIDF